MKKGRSLWRWWAKALGEKASKCDKESDSVALIRTFIFITYLITNAFIIAGVIRQWNRSPTVVILEREIPSTLSQTEKEKIIEANRRKFPYD
jgi:hypothetical protein